MRPRSTRALTLLALVVVLAVLSLPAGVAPAQPATRPNIVPLLVQGPGVRRGEIAELAANIDLAPTIAELTEATLPDFVDGRSLVPLLEGRSPPEWRDAALVEAFGRDEVIAALEIGDEPSNPPFKALRLRDRVYVEYPRSGERELYDLRGIRSSWRIWRAIPRMPTNWSNSMLGWRRCWLAQVKGVGRRRSRRRDPKPSVTPRPALTPLPPSPVEPGEGGTLPARR